MSTARIHIVKHARQLFQKVPKTNEAGERVITPVMRKSGQPKLSRKGRPIVRRISVADKTKPRDLLKCGKCGVTINLGDPYRWFTVGFRSHYKQIRCMKSECTPRPSQLESSSMRADIMSAMEGAEDDLSKLDPSSVEVEEVESIVQTVGEAFRDAGVVSLGGGLVDVLVAFVEASADELESWNGERADTCEVRLIVAVEALGVAASVERFVGFPVGRGDDDTPEVDKGDSECANCATIRENWGNELIDEANEALGNAEMP